MPKINEHQSELIDYLKALINIASVTPNDNGCQLIIKKFLENLGFETHEVNHSPVSNLWAIIGDTGPLIVFAGHTDVVDSGELHQWHTPPFEATIKNQHIYGRGACDMKGALCAMLFAAKRLVEKKQRPFRLGFLITSGEEGDKFDLGTPKVMEYLNQHQIHIDYCIIGEPSSQKTLGDMVKIGRRGSLTGSATILGKQGHVAYPNLATNPIHHVGSLLNALVNTHYDEGNAFFPATSFQLCHIHSGSGAGNVIPGALTLKFNFRFSTELNDEQLRAKTESLFNEHLSIPYKLSWRLNGSPFLTKHGTLTATVTEVIKNKLGIKPELSTTGGTSDGRFIAPYCKQVIELGSTNATIHQVNESIAIDELLSLEEVYYELVEKLIAL